MKAYNGFVVSEKKGSYNRYFRFRWIARLWVKIKTIGIKPPFRIMLTKKCGELTEFIIVRIDSTRINQ